MCIAFCALEHPVYSLILCTNRDEFLHRPTLHAHFHSFNHQTHHRSSDVAATTTRQPNDPPQKDVILSGIDQVAGGTWFGLNRKNGRVALLTNITELPQNFASSRGTLVSSFLGDDKNHATPAIPDSDSSPGLAAYLEGLRNSPFAGFNLLLLAPKASPCNSLMSEESTSPSTVPSDDDVGLLYDAALVTNKGASGPITSRVLDSGERICTGVSNGIDGLGADEWPKVVLGKSKFASAVNTKSKETNLTAEEEDLELAKRLFDVLQWHCPQPMQQRTDLRNTIQVLPFSLALPNPLPLESASTPTPPTGDAPSPSLQGLVYGTRLSTVLLIRRDGSVLFIERDLWKLVDGQVTRGDEKSDRIFRFTIDRDKV